MTASITLTINGQPHTVEVEPRRTLADVIREDCGLTGTNIGCEHGVCGTCTIIADGEAVRACLMFAVQAEGMDLVTVEGLAEGDQLSPLQQAFMKYHALQCGYCTPGFLTLATATLRRAPEIAEDELRDVLSSNLCRCTGYKNIMAAVQSVQADAKAAKK